MAEERRLSAVDVKDENRLAELGYKQELRRDWTVMHNFGVSFSIIVSPTTKARNHQLVLN
jgi:hypothetical protein